MPSKSKSVDESQSALTLHYIDKIYTTMSRIWDTSNNVFNTNVIISLILLASSTGLTTVESNIEFLGLKFTNITLWIILGFGALLIEIFILYYMSLMSHANRLRNEIRRLYKGINYVEKAMDDVLTSPFENPSEFLVLVAPTISSHAPNDPSYIKWFDRIVGSLVVLVLFMILPLSAQIASFVKMILIFGWEIWVLIPFSILIIITVLTFLCT